MEPNIFVSADPANSEFLLRVPVRSRGGFCFICSTLDFFSSGTSTLLVSALVALAEVTGGRVAERLSSLSLALVKSVPEVV